MPDNFLESPVAGGRGLLDEARTGGESGGEGPPPTDQVDLRQLAERLSGLVRRGNRGEGSPEQVDKTLARMLSALGKPFPLLPAPAGANLALTLHGLARSGGQDTALKAFSCLIRTGRFGLALAASLMEAGNISGDAAAESLMPYDASAALGIINQVLLQAGLGPAPAGLFAIDLLPRAAEADFIQARPFLAITSGSRPGLAHPLRVALWEGRIGRDILQMDPRQAPVVRLKEAASWLALLRPAGLKPEFAAGLALNSQKPCIHFGEDR